MGNDVSGRTDLEGFDGDAGYQSAYVTLLFLMCVLFIYHSANMYFHTPNKTKTFAAVQGGGRKEPSITASHTVTASASKGGGSGGGVMPVKVCGKEDVLFTLTPNNTSMVAITLALLATLTAWIRVWVTEEDWYSCEMLLSINAAACIIGRCFLMMFLMLRVQILVEQFSPLQKAVAKNLWYFFLLGYAVSVGIQFTNTSDVQHTDEGKFCRDDPVVQSRQWWSFWIYAVTDGVTQTVALVLFIRPMFQYLQTNKNHELSVSEKLVFRMVSKIAAWSTLMIFSTVLNSVFYLIFRYTVFVYVDQVLNMYCMVKQFLRRKDNVLLYVFACGCYGDFREKEEQAAQGTGAESQMADHLNSGAAPSVLRSELAPVPREDEP